MPETEDRSDAHLARERWEAHREKHQGEKDLSEQRWKAHAEKHDDIARSLDAYKLASNEWRGSLSDLRETFAEASQVNALERRVADNREELKSLIATEREERREQQNLRAGSLNTWKAIAAFLGASSVGALVWAFLQQNPAP